MSGCVSIALPMASSSGWRKGEDRKDVQERYSLPHQRPSLLVFGDAVTGKTISSRHVRHVKANCADHAANSQFGENSGEWASLSLTSKICQVLQIDRLDTALCAL